VVVIDANVLYGIEATDLLLTLAVRRAIRVHWSPEILDEVRRNLAKRPDVTVAAISYRLDQMNRALPAALEAASDELAATMPVNDKDRHVLALAVHVEASILVTHNLRDFPESVLGPLGVEALDPDAFLTRLAVLGRDDLLAAVRDIAARRRRPPRTFDAILDRLDATIPATVAILRDSSP
jgi:predicted nucleic acid-binding protein